MLVKALRPQRDFDRRTERMLPSPMLSAERVASITSRKRAVGHPASGGQCRDPDPGCPGSHARAASGPPAGVWVRLGAHHRGWAGAGGKAPRPTRRSQNRGNGGQESRGSCGEWRGERTSRSPVCGGEALLSAPPRTAEGRQLGGSGQPQAERGTIQGTGLCGSRDWREGTAVSGKSAGCCVCVWGGMGWRPRENKAILTRGLFIRCTGFARGQLCPSFGGCGPGGERAFGLPAARVGVA